MVDVSVVFVNYNTCELTLEAIKSVYEKTKKVSFEIIVVDNASQDDSVISIRQKFPKVKLVENKENKGFGTANNLGVNIAQGRYLYLLNTDTYLVNSAVDILFDFMEVKHNGNVAVAGTLLFNKDMTLSICAGHFPSFELFVKGSFWKIFYKESYYSKIRIADLKINEKTPFEVDYVSGASYFVRRDVFIGAGGFDERFFMYFEETELTYRLKKLKPDYRVMVVPGAHVVHISQGSSINTKNTRKFKYRMIKSKTLYFKLTQGNRHAFMYYIVALKRFLFNN